GRGLGRRRRERVRIGTPDPTVTGSAGLVAVAEVVDRLGIVGALDEGIGPLKQRDRGLGGGALLVGMATSQLEGESSLAGLSRPPRWQPLRQAGRPTDIR
ncbi:hypothetical protein, partial [Candidatus Protofrankia datiscae]|uniref:hypothetical protein n=2 Tax=Protofrankia TaxID=2994361 RepID=UPI0019D2E23A